MLYLVGIGLDSEKDITLKGLEAVRSSEKIYLEEYTSQLSVPVSQLEQLYGKEVVRADRETIQDRKGTIVEEARSGNISVLVIGDALSATTHVDLLQTAKERQVGCTVIHNASIMTAVSVCGLPLYNYGQTVSIPFFTEKWMPESFYDRIVANKQRGLHTLCLLDIKVKERDEDGGYRPSRFMSVSDAARQILFVAQKRKDGAIEDSTVGVGLARIGTQTEAIHPATLAQLAETDLGAPLHSLVIPGSVTVYEKEFYEKMFSFSQFT
ncbi:MAG: diphthine synthase [Amphiamblys sp. WSBS2006]|nr:MAG: diphthine synthase [Amphiamblys sp. WSBS2006]